uniref:peptidylprolyl isomerase n=1 Tax=Chromera velia CCMP2878 TaxID=1169474 RepID=A0A0G4GFZ4_9ALVE|eukprot:Cvel_4634.t1-p1 / transcript=Cvel_4634.t1 / gene=Cvel_4634 / organism=Chromera_velia_CCMP2878 / gene_product=70 kDa peptidyl-prolyl isomerase, putative / transcript_product=70 kDa peptidyl-prolyl isomerase, putative / location=Cvel_scaffold204:52628-56339(+) / protein_length=383 / sequence_SO=supercontig / SO=protein_coding / is_pseudo=false
MATGAAEGTPMDNATLMETARAHKAAGNELFKEGKHKEALKKYHLCLLHVKAVSDPNDVPVIPNANGRPHVPEDEKRDARQLRLDVLLNMSFAHLKTQNFKRAKECATDALDVGKHAKAFFRRAQALMELGDLEGARSDLKEAQDLCPEDHAIHTENKRLNKLLAEHKQKERDTYAKIFGSSGAGDDDHSKDSKENNKPNSSRATSASRPAGGGAKLSQEVNGGTSAAGGNGGGKKGAGGPTSSISQLTADEPNGHRDSPRTGGAGAGPSPSKGPGTHQTAASAGKGSGKDGAKLNWNGGKSKTASSPPRENAEAEKEKDGGAKDKSSKEKEKDKDKEKKKRDRKEKHRVDKEKDKGGQTGTDGGAGASGAGGEKKGPIVIEY